MKVKEKSNTSIITIHFTDVFSRNIRGVPNKSNNNEPNIKGGTAVSVVL